MSWKRILRAARRMGAPVIVADEQGSDPLVIMPLDMFERSQTEEYLVPANHRPVAESSKVEYRAEARNMSGNKVSEPDERAASAFETLPVQPVVDQELPVIGQKFSSGSMERAVEDIKTDETDAAEIPLEERFYFEPLDDGFKK